MHVLQNPYDMLFSLHAQQVETTLQPIAKARGMTAHQAALCQPMLLLPRQAMLRPHINMRCKLSPGLLMLQRNLELGNILSILETPINEANTQQLIFELLQCGSLLLAKGIRSSSSM